MEQEVVKTGELTPPEAVKPVEGEKAEGLVKLDDRMMDSVTAKVNEFIETVLSSDVQSKEFADKVQSIHNLGSKAIKSSASVSNRLLERPVKAMDKGFFDSKSPVSKALIDLRNRIDDLNPANQGDLFSPRKILGLFPFGNKVRDYFMKYESSQTHIESIINSLYEGQDELRKDNADLEQEKQNLWTLMLQLKQYILAGKRIDEALEARAADIEATDAEKARVVREEMLFYVRQKVQDLLTQMAVSVQGYLALDMIRKNNLELIKGVDRATTTTISALRTAIIVSQALVNQKLVLDQIRAIRSTTGDLIESTSRMLKQQTGETHQQATQPAVEIEKLQTAFNNIYETMDMIATYKLEALDSMKQTVNTLSAEVDKAKKYMDRVRTEEAGEAVSGLKVAEPGEIEI